MSPQLQSRDNDAPFPTFDLGKIFIGREQQIDFFEIYFNRWRDLVFEAETDDTLTTPPSPNNKIQGLVVLLYGRGGFGKSTLLKRYRAIGQDTSQGTRSDKVITSEIVDWEFATEGRRSLFNPPRGQGIDAYEYYKVVVNRLAAVLNKKSQEFKCYQNALKEIDRARNEANEVIRKIQKNEHYISLRALAGPAAMTLLRWVAPRVGQVLDNAKVAEKIEEIIGRGAELGVEQLLHLHTQIKEKLGAKLGYYLEPEIYLGLALGKDLCEFAKNFPLLIFFDTYEEIDEGDHLLRILMGAAGIRVGWVIAGRDNLWAGEGQRKRSLNFEYGYKEIVPQDRCLQINFNDGGIGAFTLSDIVQYFALLRKETRYKPSLPVITDHNAERILEVTQGVPLAVKIAAGLYLETANLDIVTEKAESKRRIVDQMVERYLLHTRDNLKERGQLYGLALLRRAQEPTAIATALGLTQDEVTTNYTDALRQLHRRYSFIFTENEQPTLHQEVRYFLRFWLLEYRKLPEIMAVNEHLTKAQEAIFKELEERRQYNNLRERLEDQEWVELYLDLTEQFFWLDPVQGLDYALPFMLAAAIYRRDINHDIVEIGKFFENVIPQPYRRRWESAAQSLIYRTSFDPSHGELKGLEELARLLNHRFPHFSELLLSNDYQKELEGALCWRLGEAFYGKNKKKSLEWYNQALNWLGAEVELREAAAHVAHTIAIDLAIEEKFEEAISLFNQAIELDPAVPYVYSDRGNAFNGLQEYQLAIADYNRAIELDPTHNHFYGNRGTAYHSIEEYQLAIADYNRAIELELTDSLIFTNRAQSYASIKEYRLAIADYCRAIELDPTNFTAYNNRGTIYNELESYQEAIVDFSRAIKLNHSKAIAHMNRGIVYDNLEEYERAIDDFTQAIILDDTDAIIITLRGEVYRKIGRFNEALTDFNQAIALDGNNAVAITQRGEVYRETGRYQEALDDFNRAIELDATQMDSIFINRGLVLSYLGRYVEAIESYMYDKEYLNNFSSLYNITIAMISLSGIPLSQEYIERARIVLLSLVDTDAHGIAAYGLGGLAAATGNISEALTYLNEAIRHEKEVIRWARHDIAWRALHDNPSFEKLIPRL